MLRAERRLLAAALQEPRNSVFVLLSESYVEHHMLSFIGFLSTDRGFNLISFNPDAFRYGI